jgi:hypothetical protein
MVWPSSKVRTPRILHGQVSGSRGGCRVRGWRTAGVDRSVVERYEENPTSLNSDTHPPATFLALVVMQYPSLASSLLFVLFSSRSLFPRLPTPNSCFPRRWLVWFDRNTRGWNDIIITIESAARTTFFGRFETDEHVLSTSPWSVRKRAI